MHALTAFPFMKSDKPPVQAGKSQRAQRTGRKTSRATAQSEGSNTERQMMHCRSFKGLKLAKQQVERTKEGPLFSKDPL